MPYIVFEGCDATGKTTVSQSVHSKLLESGVNTIWTGHPGATEIGKKLRDLVKYSDVQIDPFTEQLLMTVDNSAFIHLKLKKELKKKTMVIADRCNIIGAYTYGVASGNSIEDLKAQHAVLKNKFEPIDLLFVFVAPWEVIKERMAKRGIDLNDRIESRGEKFFRDVLKLYQDIVTPGTEIHYIIKSYAKRVQVIDATQPIDKVVESCSAFLRYI